VAVNKINTLIYRLTTVWNPSHTDRDWKVIQTFAKPAMRVRRSVIRTRILKTIVSCVSSIDHFRNVFKMENERQRNAFCQWTWILLRSWPSIILYSASALSSCYFSHRQAATAFGAIWYWPVLGYYCESIQTAARFRLKLSVCLKCNLRGLTIKYDTR